MKNTLDLKILCQEAIEIARAAGDIVMEYYHNGAKEMIKSDGSDVTEADLASDKFITEKLKALTPDIPVVTEEGIEAGIVPDVSKGRYWICDPIDGTISFMKRHDNFSILIALLDNFVPVIGIAYYPAKNEYFYAIKGQGSFHVNTKIGERKPLVTHPPKSEFPIVVCSPNYNDETNFLKIAGHIPEPYRRFEFGNYFYEMLTGDIDALVFTRISGGEWDIAAFKVIIEEAGGRLGNDAIQFGNIMQKMDVRSAHAHADSYAVLYPNA